MGNRILASLYSTAAEFAQEALRIGELTLVFLFVMVYGCAVMEHYLLKVVLCG